MERIVCKLHTHRHTSYTPAHPSHAAAQTLGLPVSGSSWSVGCGRPGRTEQISQQPVANTCPLHQQVCSVPAELPHVLMIST